MFVDWVEMRIKSWGFKLRTSRSPFMWNVLTPAGSQPTEPSFEGSYILGFIHIHAPYRCRAVAFPSFGQHQIFTECLLHAWLCAEFGQGLVLMTGSWFQSLQQTGRKLLSSGQAGACLWVFSHPIDLSNCLQKKGSCVDTVILEPVQTLISGTVG